MTPSLHARLLIAATLVLTAFLGLTGLALDRAFQASAQTAVRDRLQGYVYVLLAAADIGPDGVLELPVTLPDARFSTPASGLYAEVTANRGPMRWRSRSAIGLAAPLPTQLPPGQWRFLRIRSAAGEPLFALGFGVSWEGGHGARDYTFAVAENLAGFRAQVARFRRSLWGWLAAAAAVLLAAQGAILHWGLAPLRRVTRDLAAIEEGRRERLEGRYPRELRGLTGNLNSLIAGERRQRARYRDALADLAHSLKTPLAVLRGALSGAGTSAEERRASALEAAARMNQIIDYQLQRAAASGRSTLMAPVDVARAARRVAGGLAKVYQDKGVSWDVYIDDGVCFYGDEGDLMELLGNLADNAFKWCRQRVQIRAQALLPTSGRRAGLRLRIEDDGPGIAAEAHARVLQRGERADSAVGGQGIGLAVVADIVRAYDGRLELGASALGGAAVEVTLPAA